MVLLQRVGCDDVEERSVWGFRGMEVSNCGFGYNKLGGGVCIGWLEMSWELGIGSRSKDRDEVGKGDTDQESMKENTFAWNLTSLDMWMMCVDKLSNL